MVWQSACMSAPFVRCRVRTGLVSFSMLATQQRNARRAIDVHQSHTRDGRWGAGAPPCQTNVGGSVTGSAIRHPAVSMCLLDCIADGTGSPVDTMHIAPRAVGASCSMASAGIS